jgi:hypothetical protein
MAQLDPASDDSDAIPIANGSSTEKRALSRIERRLTDEDLRHPGVQKMILDRLDVAEEQLAAQEALRDNYHEATKELAIAQSSLKRISALDTLQSTTLGVGCLILGFLPAAWGDWRMTVIAAASGIALVMGSFFAKRRNQ